MKFSYFDNEGNFYRIDNGHHHSNKKAGVGTGDADTQFGDEQLNGIKRIQKSLLKVVKLLRKKFQRFPFPIFVVFGSLFFTFNS